MKPILSLCRKCMLLFLVIAFLMVVVSCDTTSDTTTSTEKTETITLKLAHFFPAKHPAEVDLVQGWAEAIEKATDGQVEIESYPGGSLLEPDQVYSGVVDGVADIGLSCFAYTRGRFPVLEAFELPGIVYENSKVASEVAWEGIKKLDPEEVQDTELMMVIATGPGDLLTKEPVEKLEDLQGLEIRATGLSTKTIKSLGGIPVAMPQSGVYEALKKGIVKGNLSPVEVLKGWKQAEVTNYLTRTPFLYNTLFYITMNSEKWNSFSSDIQEAILEVNESFHEEVGIGLWDKQNEAAVDWAVKEHGIKIKELSEEETSRWMDKVRPIQDEYREKNKDKTDQDVIKMIEELAEEYNEKY